MTTSVTLGRALRYAEGSARGLLHHHRGHCRGPWRETSTETKSVAWMEEQMLLRGWRSRC